MTFKEAVDFRDKYKLDVMGKVFIDVYGNPYDKAHVTDVIIAPKDLIKEIVNKMTFDNLKNEIAIQFFTSLDRNDFDVFIISYHSMGDGHLYHASLKFQLQRMNILPPDPNQ